MVGFALRHPLSRLLLWGHYAADSFRPARQPNFSLSVLGRGDEPERPRRPSPSRRHPTASLFLGYGLFKSGVIGSAGLLVYAAVIGFTPIILAPLASRFFKPELVRPVAMRPATA